MKCSGQQKQGIQRLHGRNIQAKAAVAWHGCYVLYAANQREHNYVFVRHIWKETVVQGVYWFRSSIASRKQ